MPSDRVKRFYGADSFAILGMSRTRKNFAWLIHEQFRSFGRRLYPIRPGAGAQDGITFFDSLTALPERPDAVVVALKPPRTAAILQTLKELQPEFLWLQQGSYDKSVLKEAERLGLNPIKGCVFMYMPDAPFFHRIHRALNDLFGKGYR